MSVRALVICWAACWSIGPDWTSCVVSAVRAPAAPETVCGVMLDVVLGVLVAGLLVAVVVAGVVRVVGVFALDAVALWCVLAAARGGPPPEVRATSAIA